MDEAYIVQAIVMVGSSSSISDAASRSHNPHFICAKAWCVPELPPFSLGV